MARREKSSDWYSSNPRGRTRTAVELARIAVSELLDRRFKFALKHHFKGKPKKRFPKELTYGYLANQIGVSRSTLRRWYLGKVKRPNKIKVLGKLRRMADRITNHARRVVKKSGIKLPALLLQQASKIRYKHGIDTWRVITLGWNRALIVELLKAIRRAGKFWFRLIYWTSYSYKDIAAGRSEDDPLNVGGHGSTMWGDATGKTGWTDNLLNTYVLNTQMRGEIVAVYYGLPREGGTE